MMNYKTIKLLQKDQSKQKKIEIQRMKTKLEKAILDGLRFNDEIENK